MPTYHHYALLDPREIGTLKAIRYIGRTVKTIQSRIYCHLSEAKNRPKTYRDHWIRNLLALGLEPTVIELGDGDQYKESELISRFRSWGFALTNLTDGGDGIPGLKHSDETRKKLTAFRTGRSPSAETREKLRIAHTGRVLSVEARQKMSDAGKRKILSEEHKQKIALAGVGRIQTEEKKQKLRDASAQRVANTGIKIGETFNRLTVIGEAGQNKQGSRLLECQCKCGNKTIVRSASLRNGNTKSCGCLSREKSSARAIIRNQEGKGKRKKRDYSSKSNL